MRARALGGRTKPPADESVWKVVRQAKPPVPPCCNCLLCRGGAGGSACQSQIPATFHTDSDARGFRAQMVAPAKAGVQAEAYATRRRRPGPRMAMKATAIIKGQLLSIGMGAASGPAGKLLPLSQFGDHARADEPPKVEAAADRA